MDLSVFLAVLLAAVLHAGWSAAIKTAADPRTATLAVSIGTSILAALALVWTGPLDPAGWQWLAASLCAHAAYMRLTAQAYVTGDLSLVYPISRGLAPIAATGLAALVAGEAPGPLALAGVAAVGAGALTIGLSAVRADRDHAPAVILSVIVAGCIAAYTLLDGQGARAARDPIGYAAWLMLLQGAANLVAFTVFGGGAAMLRDALRMLPFGLAGGAVSGAGYAIALWAMTLAPIGAVAALRETSIAFAALIGALVLKERVTAARLAGVGLILAGAGAIRLG